MTILNDGKPTHYCEPPIEDDLEIIDSQIS